MSSPFPGMDPYLEDPAFWPDFHLTFIGCWREAIADVLPAPYDARLDERVNLIQMSPEIIKLVYPDVAVSHAKKGRRRPANGQGGTLLLEPVTVQHEFVEEVRQSRIEILHRADRTLVTVLELLSPTNKTGDGLLEYRAKRNALMGRRVHLVELDLLVGGERLPMRQPLPPGDYHALVTRGPEYPDCEVFSWSVRRPLPRLPIPLRAPDQDVHVDLGAIFRTTYKRGRYGAALRYGRAPRAPLSDVDTKWAVKISKSV